MAVNPLFQRLSLLTGAEALERLGRTHVMVFGLGGVGSWCAEALVRSGIGKISLIDSDTVCVTNVNRQVQATGRTLGRLKVDALGERLREINPFCEIRCFGKVFSREGAGLFDIGSADYVIDAIDSLTHKLDLIELSLEQGAGFFSSMGMAQKLDPTRLKTADIWKTSVCPLARLVRQGLRKRGFRGHFTVVYSDERLPLREPAEGEISCGTGRCLCPARDRGNPEAPVEWCSSKKVINGSAVTVTATAGMILASLVLRAPPRGFQGGGRMSNRFLRDAASDRAVQKLCLKAILERGLIAPGDRVLIAVSGGKDSTVLAWALAALRPALKMDYSLEALHISSDFCACCKKAALAARLEGWGIPFTDLFVPVIGRLKEGEKMNCYWCSTQRRTELLKYAVERGFNKIALGHHLDDIIETFFMNMTGKGELAAMPLSLAYRKYPATLIRPLGYLEERQIIACAEKLDILAAACTCPFGLNSKRRDIRARIAEFTGGSGAVKRRILRALASGPRDFLAE